MGPPISILTVQQPFAWAIMAGLKRPENRVWHTSYRGPVVIHAGLGRELEEQGYALLKKLGARPPPPEQIVRGKCLGTVELVDCVRFDRQAIADGLFDDVFDEHNLRGDKFATGPWCLIFALPKKFRRPISYRGAQGLRRLKNDRVYREALVTIEGLTHGPD